MPIAIPGVVSTGGETSSERPSLRERWFWIAPDETEFELTRFTNGVEVIKGRGGRGAPPAVINRYQVPGKPGQRTSSVAHGLREFTMPLFVDGGDFEGLHTLLEKLVTYMDPVSGEGTLRRMGRDGSQNDLFCRLATGLGIAGEGSSGPAYFRPVLIFQADDPYWYGQTKTKGFAGTAAKPWFNILPLQLGSSSVLGNASIVNDSKIETYPVWTIKGPGSAASFLNTTTGKQFAVDFPVTIGPTDTVVIDTREYVKTVTGPGGANWRRYLSPRSLWPLVGGENKITLTLNDTTEASYVSVAWRERKLYAR